MCIFSSFFVLGWVALGFWLATMASQANPALQGQSSGNMANPAQPIVSGQANQTPLTRNNGVVLKASDNVSVQSYVDSLTKKIPASEVLFASRISNGRVAIYLKSKEAVVHAVTEGLEHDNSFELSPLVRPTTRLTLSNVYPEIPNQVLVQNLSGFCKIVSNIRPIPMGFKDKNLSHIMSFRRNVQVLLNPNITPPDNINFT